MKKPITRQLPLFWLPAALAALLVAVTGGLWLGQVFSQKSGNGHVVVEQRPQRRDFSLTDTNGQRVTLATYQGKWLLMFFGFTMCPEACPLAMQKVSATLQNIGGLGKEIQAIFITIDPERDTPAILKEYLANFDDNIFGLSGTDDETAAVAKLYGVFYRKRPLGTDYTMDHSTALYLIAPDGSYVRPFRADVGAEELVDDLGTEMKNWKQ
ncbi:MAG: SCO family protein [Rhodospirillaceae bacterium]|nr:SCO family protein [Rhodospirillaceae bacterium]